MRICMIVEDYPPAIGGGGLFVQKLSCLLAGQYGHEVKVISRPHGPNEGMSDEKGVSVLRIPGSRAIFALKAMMHAISSERFDIYHAHGTIPGFIARLAGIFKGSKTILHVHGYRSKDAIGSLKFFMQNFVLRLGFSKIISVDRPAAMQVISLGIPKERVEVIPVGLDTPCSVPAKKAMGNQRVFLFVGRLEKIKDVPTILKAAKILRENRQAAKILIVGDGSMRNELEDFAKQNNISNVEFAGAVQHDALPSFYNKADFFILPSLSEGMPLSLLEGMACGLPAITSDVPSLSSIVSESNAGMAFAVGNETSLAGAIAKFAKLPAKDYSRLSENARKYAKKFSWDDVAKKINSIYSGL